MLSIHRATSQLTISVHGITKTYTWEIDSWVRDIMACVTKHLGRSQQNEALIQYSRRYASQLLEKE
jgi:hypothetical protein